MKTAAAVALRAVRSATASAIGTAAKARRAVDITDAFVFGGLGCTAWGVAMIHEPAAWIVVGVTLMWLGLRR